MSTETKPPFELPPAPIDRYEVIYYQVGSTEDHSMIQEVRLVYYVNARWEDVFPEDDRPGKPIVNHWMIFRDGCATGRTQDGWDVFADWDWHRCFASKKEAERAAVDAVQRSILLRQRQLHELHGKLAALEGHRSALHFCPSCVCGKITVEWSDRSADVWPDDPESIAEAIVNCSLDHSYDRTGTGVPHGFEPKIKDTAAPVCAKHLAAARPDWQDHTVHMSPEAREAFKAELVDALRPIVEPAQ